ncbi:DUF6402 family protein [Burkholderia arboris]|uniref:DUF6402 family protein n=1 Tax=Burkholderia arboris TaxID=488730 RepID=UPI0030B834E8
MPVVKKVPYYQMEPRLLYSGKHWRCYSGVVGCVRFRKFRAKDVYWPVHNKTYRHWRSVRNRGGDFMVYSKPKLIKLDKPIILKIDTVYRTISAE